MAIWYIRHALNKTVTRPGDRILLTLEIHNPHKDKHLFITKLSLKGPKAIDYTYDSLNVFVFPNTRRNLALLEVPIPNNIRGKVELRLHVHTYRTDREVENVENLGALVRKGPIEVQVSPVPFYRAFVSRSILLRDRPITESIVKMIQDWGFETHTVGINSFIEKHTEPTDAIIGEIIRSDCLVAIATIRDKSAFTGLCSTLEWLHSEVAFAYLTQMPILLIVEEGIAAEGILRQTKWPIITFTSGELKKLQYELDEIVPRLRLAVEEKKARDFGEFLQDIQRKAALGGYLAGLEAKRLEDSSSAIRP